MNKPVSKQIKRSISSVGQKKHFGTTNKTVKHIGFHSISHSHKLLASVKQPMANVSKLQFVLTEMKADPTTDSAYIALRGMVRGMFGGDRPYHFLMGSAGGITTYTTTGTISSVINFTSDIQVSNNWTPLSGIFDEFCYVKSKHQFSPYGGGFNVASPSPTFTAFDDDGIASAATLYSGGTIFISAYPTCKMACPAIQGSTLTSEANSTGFEPYTRHHSRPYAANVGPVVNAQSTGWIDVATPNNMLGALLTYNPTVSGTNNVNAYFYFCQYEVAFRCVR
jgi:hypothetical protein